MPILAEQLATAARVPSLYPQAGRSVMLTALIGRLLARRREARPASAPELVALLGLIT